MERYVRDVDLFFFFVVFNTWFLHVLTPQLIQRARKYIIPLF